jgi:hypothetical protein
MTAGIVMIGDEGPVVIDSRAACLRAENKTSLLQMKSELSNCYPYPANIFFRLFRITIKSDDEDEDAIIERRRKEREALMKVWS